MNQEKPAEGREEFAAMAANVACTDQPDGRSGEFASGPLLPHGAVTPSAGGHVAAEGPDPLATDDHQAQGGFGDVACK